MYNQEKDVLIKLYEFNEEKTNFLVSIFSYDNGKPKLGLTRSYQKKDGTMGYSSSGRLSIDEVNFLRNNIDDIIKIMVETNSEKIS